MATTNFPLSEPDVVMEMLCDLETAVTHACAVIDALRQQVRDLRAERDALLEFSTALTVKKKAE